MTLTEIKRRVVHTLQRHVVNPIGRRSPATMLETTGRTSGQPRHTAVGGQLDGNTFWVVSEHGTHSDYVKNIQADPAVRLRLHGVWRTGTAHPMPEDDPRARLRARPAGDSAVVKLFGTDLLTIRIDLD